MVNGIGGVLKNKSIEYTMYCFQFLPSFSMQISTSEVEFLSSVICLSNPYPSPYRENIMQQIYKGDIFRFMNFN